MSESERSALGDEFDRIIRHLTGLPDTVHTELRTIRTLTPDRARGKMVRHWHQEHRS